ncbi:hypothetical protein [Collimonas fungivorans]|nr:hypothetical protein [Collimonas fungivorans]
MDEKICTLARMAFWRIIAKQVSNVIRRCEMETPVPKMVGDYSKRIT